MNTHLPLGRLWALATASALSVAAAQVPPASAPGTAAPDAQSPACREALRALQAVETQQPAPTSEPGNRERGLRLQAARERASQACLGGPAGRPAPVVQTPPAVPPVSRPAPSPAPRLPTASPPPPPVVANPPPSSGMPLTVVACDTTGCTASDGTRLTRSGPHLVGPRGACTLQGAVLRCPQ